MRIEYHHTGREHMESFGGFLYPNRENVQSKIDKFNREEEAIETALALLIGRYPLNTEIREVYVKVKVLNVLYATQILGIGKVAERIVECAIDSRLERGDPDVVAAIANVQFKGKNRCNYSFATKYCSWHRPEKYPIFDSRVAACLVAYRSQGLPDPFAKFVGDDLWNYLKFLDVVKAFRTRYHLEDFSFKDIDKFLYETGSDYFNWKEAARTPVPTPGSHGIDALERLSVAYMNSSTGTMQRNI
jgi:hypothetical protein